MHSSVVESGVDSEGKIEFSAGREVEIKLLGDTEALQKAIESAVLAGARMQPRAQSFHSVYYDTEGRALQRAGIVLRVRRARGRHILTAKFPPEAKYGLFSRGEFEVRIPSPEPDATLFESDVAACIEQATAGATLGAVYSTSFRRKSGVLVLPQTTVEIALDSGTIEAAGKQAPIQEIELEMRQGDEAGLCDLAAHLVEHAGLRLGTLTKGARGSILAGGVGVSASKGKMPVLETGVLVDDFIASVIDVCLQQFTGNWNAIEADCGPEGVHQARVALRRLRAMLGLFAKFLPGRDMNVFRSEAKRLASVLSPARDWDVFIGMVEKGPLSFYSRDKSFDALLELALSNRQQAYDSARKVIADPATSIFVLQLRAFTARRGWRSGLSGAELLFLTRSATEYAAHTLDRMHKRIMKRGKQLKHLDINEKHALRIELKKLRYAAEFFGPLFGLAHQKRYVRAAGKLQDVLGAFNDEAVAHGLLDVLDAQGQGAVARASGVVLGWCGRGRADADLVLQPAWERFAKVRHFWK